MVLEQRRDVFGDLVCELQALGNGAIAFVEHSSLPNYITIAYIWSAISWRGKSNDEVRSHVLAGCVSCFPSSPGKIRILIAVVRVCSCVCSCDPLPLSSRSNVSERTPRRNGNHGGAERKLLRSGVLVDHSVGRDRSTLADPKSIHLILLPLDECNLSVVTQE